MNQIECLCQKEKLLPWCYCSVFVLHVTAVSSWFSYLGSYSAIQNKWYRMNVKLKNDKALICVENNILRGAHQTHKYTQTYAYHENGHDETTDWTKNVQLYNANSISENFSRKDASCLRSNRAQAQRNTEQNYFIEHIVEHFVRTV